MECEGESTLEMELNPNRKIRTESKRKCNTNLNLNRIIYILQARKDEGKTPQIISCLRRMKSEGKIDFDFLWRRQGGGK